MRKLPLDLLMFLAGFMICAGCTVKENRSLCPCMLVLDFSGVDMAVVGCADLIMNSDDGFLFTDELEVEDFSSGLSLPVPRSVIRLGLWSGEGVAATYDGLEIPKGEDCPPVYFHASVVDARCEMLQEKIFMRKNHCNLTVNLLHEDAGTWRICLFGNVNGYMSDGSPSEGEFSCELERDGDGGFSACLPRQTDNSLAMELDDGSGIVKRFSIGEYIAESGYDWGAPDLEDLVMDIDIAFTGIVLTIRGWDDFFKFDVVI